MNSYDDSICLLFLLCQTRSVQFSGTLLRSYYCPLKRDASVEEHSTDTIMTFDIIHVHFRLQ